MPLHKIRDFDPDYRQHFGDRDILNFDVYSGSEKVGSVDDLLVDESGRFRYLVINTGAWIFGKKVLLPIGRSRIDNTARRVYADGLTREQVQHLPEYTGEITVDYDYEERVRTVYRSAATASGVAAHDRHNYQYDRDPALYTLNDRDHSDFSRYESRPTANRSNGGSKRRSVGVFPDRTSAERALHELRNVGFPMDRVSVVTRDPDSHDQIAGAEVRDQVATKADEGATIGAVSGGALGGLTGLLVGLGSLAIPGVGPIMLAGATATALATTLAGGAIGAVSGSLLGALIGLGIPEDRARSYQERIVRGGYLVIVDGSDEEIARAQTVLHRQGIEDYDVYNVPGATSGRSVMSPATSIPVTTEARGTAFGRQSAVGFFPNLTSAEHAITDLKSVGFPLNQTTLVAHNLQRRERFAGVDLRDRFEAMRLGIPAEQAHFYDERINRGEYMVVVHGTEAELQRVASILNRRGLQDWRIYDPTQIDTSASTKPNPVHIFQERAL